MGFSCFLDPSVSSPGIMYAVIVVVYSPCCYSFLVIISTLHVNSYGWISIKRLKVNFFFNFIKFNVTNVFFDDIDNLNDGSEITCVYI
jgi:Fe2+ transport system protein B